jgi:hypothetical protein
MANITYKPYNSAFLSDTTTGDITGALGVQGQLQYFPRVLGVAGIPVAVANTGTIATAGAITLGTALPRIYPAIWLYFPASAVVGDATGGLYFCVMTSTTVGTVYAGKQGVANGVTASFQPTVPTTLVAVVGSNAEYTGSTTATNLVNVTIPAGTIGLNGSARVTVNWTSNNSGGAKTGKVFLLTTQVGVSSAYTSSTGGTQMISIRNAGTAAFNSSQVVGGIATSAAVYSAVDTAAATYIGIQGTVAVATDFMVLEGYTVEVFPHD